MNVVHENNIECTPRVFCHQIWGRNLSSIFSFMSCYRLRYNQSIYVKFTGTIMLQLEPIYLTKFHSSHVLNWQLEEAMIKEFEDVEKSL